MLLMSQERFQFPVLSLLLLKYEKKSSNWKAKYDGLYRDEEIYKANRLEKDQEYKKMFEYKSDQKSEVKHSNKSWERSSAYGPSTYRYPHLLQESLSLPCICYKVRESAVYFRHRYHKERKCTIN